MADITRALVPRELRGGESVVSEPQNDTIKGGKQPTLRGMIQQKEIITESLRKHGLKLKKKQKTGSGIPEQPL